MRVRPIAACSLVAFTLVLASPAVGQQAPGGPPPGNGGPPPGGMPNMPSMADTHYDTALAITDGALAAPPGGDVTGDARGATIGNGLSIASAKEARNALIVAGGKSAYTLRDSKIVLKGAGTNDFLGTGAGAMARDHATLVLIHDNIETNGRISPAAVAAEGATLRIYDSTLVANGGPLPAGYKPHIGPGMMEPPAPLGLTGTARTLLAMSNSRTYVYHSHIEADGWGALSTDATGGDLYLEANDCTVTVRRAGYGTYADFGAHVVINRSRIDSGGDLGIIAGKARIDFDHVTGRAARNGVMIHSVMAFDPSETATLNLTDSAFTAAGPVVLVKSANADISITGAAPGSTSHVLVEVRKNDDPNATQTHGAKVPGVTIHASKTVLTGDVIDTDPDRATTLDLSAASLTGALRDVILSADAASHWIASGDSTITLAPDTSIAAIDAKAGVHVVAHAGASVPHGTTPLPGGGELVVQD